MESDNAVLLPGMAVHVLQDLRCYLDIIDPVAYQERMDVLSGSSIGQHTRHIIEFFQCLVEQGRPDQMPVINYAMRKRDDSLESAPDLALAAVDLLGKQLNELDAHKSCMLDSTEHGQDVLLVPSTLARELIYTIEHTIHHLAIVKIALKMSMPSFQLPVHFGVAPSTIRFRQESCAQ